MRARPSFDELLARTDAPAGSTWGLWGAEDRRGCLNLLTPEAALRGSRAVRRGAVFPLDLPLDLPDPPLFERTGFRHDVTWLPREGGHDETLSGFNPQRSSQWDGFRHIRSRVHGFYNGLADESHGVHHWDTAGIVTRGVLADLGRWRAEAGRPLSCGEPDCIEPDELTACLADQGVAVEPGDILLIRTGWLSWYRSLDADGRAEAAGTARACGLRPGRAFARARSVHGESLGRSRQEPGDVASPRYVFATGYAPVNVEDPPPDRAAAAQTPEGDRH